MKHEQIGALAPFAARGTLNRPWRSPWVLRLASKTFQLRVYAKQWAKGCWVRPCEV
jgi:hypothetical protein